MQCSSSMLLLLLPVLQHTSVVCRVHTLGRGCKALSLQSMAVHSIWLLLCSQLQALLRSWRHLFSPAGRGLHLAGSPVVRPGICRPGTQQLRASQGVSHLLRPLHCSETSCNSLWSPVEVLLIINSVRHHTVQKFCEQCNILQTWYCLAWCTQQ